MLICQVPQLIVLRELVVLDRLYILIFVLYHSRRKKMGYSINVSLWGILALWSSSEYHSDSFYDHHIKVNWSVYLFPRINCVFLHSYSWGNFSDSVVLMFWLLLEVVVSRRAGEWFVSLYLMIPCWRSWVSHVCYKFTIDFGDQFFYHSVDVI